MIRGLRLFALAIVCTNASTGFSQGRPEIRATETNREIIVREYQLAKSYMHLENGQPPFLNLVTDVVTEKDEAGNEVKDKAGNVVKKPGRRLAVDYSKAIRQYRDRTHKDDKNAPPRTPQELFHSAIQRLGILMKMDPSSQNLQLFRDVISDYIEAEALVGNDAYADASASRFPSKRPSTVPSSATQGVDKTDKSAWEAALLAYAEAEFRNAANAALRLLAQPEIIRQGNEFGLEEAPEDDRGQRPSELKLLTYAADRVTRTVLSDAKRHYYDSAFGIGKDRNMAKLRAKESFGNCAHESYLWSASLSAIANDSATLTRNDAPELQKTMMDAQDRLRDIFRGIPPRPLPKSYIPAEDSSIVFADAKVKVADALAKETIARNLTAEYYGQVDRLHAELIGQRDKFSEPIRQLTGIAFQDNGQVTLETPGKTSVTFRIYDPDPRNEGRSREERTRLAKALQDRVENSTRKFVESLVSSGLLAPSEINLAPSSVDQAIGEWESQVMPAINPQPTGDIGQQLLRVRDAQLNLLQRRKVLDDFPERIRIEEARADRLAKITVGGAETIGAHHLAMGIANTISFQVYPKPSVNVSPGSIVSGLLLKEIELERAQMQVNSGNVERDARIKLLLLDQSTAVFDVLRAGNALIQEYATLRSQVARLEALIEGWTQTRKEAKFVFEQYPVFMMEKDASQRAADESFATALEKSYVAAKALEYQWADVYQFKIRARVGDPTLPKEYIRFQNTDSLLNARTAAELDLFLSALLEWNKLLSLNRGGMGGELERVISLKSNLLGINNGVQDAMLFKRWIREHIIYKEDAPVGLAFQFSTAEDFARGKGIKPPLFARGQWNQKIVAIAISLDGKGLFEEGGGEQPPLIQIAPGGTSYIRSFPPASGTILDYDMIGSLAPDNLQVIRDPLSRGEVTPFSEYRNHMYVRADINNPLTYHDLVKLAADGLFIPRKDRIGVACSQWTVLINTYDYPENIKLKLENIADIKIGIKYVFDKDAAWVDLK
jgi:hypothetical protein